MPQMYYKVTGFEGMDKALRELRKEMKGDEGNITAKALMKATYPVWREAQARAPVSGDDGAFTPVKQLKSGKWKQDWKAIGGTLRKSIKRIRHRNPTVWSELVGVGVLSGGTRQNPTGAYYGRFVEFGTRFQPAQPFLRPALESQRVTFEQTFAVELGRGINKAAAKIGRKYQNYGDRRTRV